MPPLAVARCPGFPLAKADMRDFDLQRSFDVVVCLFSGIGYLTEEADLSRAVATMAAHLGPGGVLLIEGWVEPHYWLGTTVQAESAKSGETAVAPVTRSRRDGMRCEVFMRYTVASRDGSTTIDERHLMQLSDPREFESAYQAAGLSFERLPHMLHPGRAMYVGALSDGARAQDGVM